MSHPEKFDAVIHGTIRPVVKPSLAAPFVRMFADIKKRLGSLVLLFVGVLVLAACSGGSTSTTNYTGAANLQPSSSLVDAAWVKRVIDYHATGGTSAAPTDYSHPTSHKYLIVETQWGPLSYATAYNTGHIPGAIHSNSETYEDGHYLLLPDADLKTKAGTEGITPDTTVIVYSDDMLFAARLWWVYKYIGVKDVRLLNGGYGAWQNAGYSVETTTNNPVATTYTGTINSAMSANTAEVTSKLNSATTQIVDVRSNSEYLGYITGYPFFYAKGRIPSSVWGHDGHSTEYLNADGTFRNATDVKNMWTALGITSTGSTFDKEIIFYCGGGYRSAVTYFYAHLLGLTNVKQYYDGWNGWSTDYTADPTGKTATSNPVTSGSFDTAFDTASTQGLLVSGAAVEANLGKANQVIIDTRSAASYAAGHIAGAINLEAKALDTTPTSHDINTPAAVAAVLGNAGVSNTATIVVYGAGTPAVDFGGQERVFWALEYMGAKDVHVLDGGYNKWATDSRAVVTTATTLPAATFTATVDATKIATKADVLAHYADATNYAIVDSRFNADYVTAHIPNAINILETDFLNADGTTKSYADIKTLLDAKGVTAGKTIITHCYVGYMSGQGYFILRLMGFNVSNYDGSWTEWAADTTLPTKTGTTP